MIIIKDKKKKKKIEYLVDQLQSAWPWTEHSFCHYLR